VFWSPGEEEDYGVSLVICRAWPGAALYTLTDAVAFTTVFAASRERLDFWKERARTCPGDFETESLRARSAIAEAAKLAKNGQVEQSAAVLEAQARRTFAYAEIFDATARALLARTDGKNTLARAVEWASRACEATAGDDPHFCATLASAHARNGDADAAILAARRAKDAALRRGDAALAGELELRIQQYARGASGESG
jgi:hypothetical protein